MTDLDEQISAKLQEFGRCGHLQNSPSFRWICFSQPHDTIRQHYKHQLVNANRFSLTPSGLLLYDGDPMIRSRRSQ